MTAPDRTDELVRAMLERRAGAPAPAWLLDSTMHEVAMAGRGRGRGRRRPRWRSRPRWRELLPEQRGARLALVAALVFLLSALVGGAFAAAALLNRPAEPQPTQPAVIVTPTGGPSSAVEPSAPPATPDETTAPTPRPAPAALAVDTLAVVTKVGGQDGLRVRTAPGVGSDSKKLAPLLSAGTRMLIVGGPVAGDGYDWYEVLTQTDEQLFGWVASGKGAEVWIEPIAPRCPDTLDEKAIANLPPIELFACYGDTPARVRATDASVGMDTGTEPPPCPYVEVQVPCQATPAWLFEDMDATLLANDEPTMSVSAPPAMRRLVDSARGVMFMTLTVAMDDPQARTCRVVNGKGHDVMPRDEAIARCRLRFVITDVAWDPALTLTHEDDLVRVLAADLPVYTHPGGDPTSRGLAAGDEMLIAEPERQEDGRWWVPVFPRAGVGWPAGWVPFLVDDRPTLTRLEVDCPQPGDWGAIVRLDVGARLACFADVEEMQFTVRVEPVPVDPSAGACGAYQAVLPSPRPCEARPTWLGSGAPAVGIDPNDESARGDLWFDPATIAGSSVLTTPTVMRLTGRFAHPAGWECEIQDPQTGEALVWEPAAQAYCRGEFVVTGMTPAP